MTVVSLNGKLILTKFRDDYDILKVDNIFQYCMTTFGTKVTIKKVKKSPKVNSFNSSAKSGHTVLKYVNEFKDTIVIWKFCQNDL